MEIDIVQPDGTYRRVVRKPIKALIRNARFWPQLQKAATMILKEQNMIQSIVFVRAMTGMDLASAKFFIINHCEHGLDIKHYEHFEN